VALAMSMTVDDWCPDQTGAVFVRKAESPVASLLDTDVHGEQVSGNA